MSVFHETKLKNGITLYYMQDKKSKRSFVNYTVNYGSNGKWFDFIYDGKEYHVRSGVAHFIEHLLGEHSKNGNIYTKFASRGYLKNGSTGFDETRYFFYGMDDVKTSIKELIEAIDLPVFTEEDIEQTKNAIISEARNCMNRNDSTITMFRLRQGYKNFELVDDSLSMIGSPENNAAMNYDTLKLCYDAFYSNDRKSLVIVSPEEEQDMIDYLESIYENIPYHENKLEEVPIDLTGVAASVDTLQKNILDDREYVSVKIINKGDNPNKEYLFNIFIKNILFDDTCGYLKELKDSNVYESVLLKQSESINNDYFITIGFKTNQINVIKEEIINVLKNIQLSRIDFELMKRKYVAELAYSMNDKFKLYNDNTWHIDRIIYSIDVDFIKNLKYEEFIEYCQNLNIDDIFVTCVTNGINKSR